MGARASQIPLLPHTGDRSRYRLYIYDRKPCQQNSPSRSVLFVGREPFIRAAENYEGHSIDLSLHDVSATFEALPNELLAQLRSFASSNTCMASVQAPAVPSERLSADTLVSDVRTMNAQDALMALIYCNLSLTIQMI